MKQKSTENVEQQEDTNPSRYGINWFKEQQEWQNRENYIPKPRRYYIF